MDESSRRVPCGIESDTWSPGWEEEHLRSVGPPQGAPAGGAGQSSGDPGGGAGALLSGRLGYISILSRNDNGSPKIALLNKNSRKKPPNFLLHFSKNYSALLPGSDSGQGGEEPRPAPDNGPGVQGVAGAGAGGGGPALVRLCHPGQPLHMLQPLSLVQAVRDRLANLS